MAVAIDLPSNTPAMPADYYRRQAVRARRLADDATTPAIRVRLRDAARQYERLADRVDDQKSAIES